MSLKINSSLDKSDEISKLTYLKGMLGNMTDATSELLFPRGIRVTYDEPKPGLELEVYNLIMAFDYDETPKEIDLFHYKDKFEVDNFVFVSSGERGRAPFHVALENDVSYLSTMISLDEFEDLSPFKDGIFDRQYTFPYHDVPKFIRQAITNVIDNRINFLLEDKNSERHVSSDKFVRKILERVNIDG